MADEKQSGEIKALYDAAQGFRAESRNFRSREMFSVLVPEDRKKLAAVLRHVMLESRRLQKLVHAICPYCREVGGEVQGECVQCGQAACTLCGTTLEGELVHRDICARFFTKASE